MQGSVPGEGEARSCSASSPTANLERSRQSGRSFCCPPRVQLYITQSRWHLNKRISPRNNNKCGRGGQRVRPAVYPTRNFAEVAQRQRMSLPRTRCGFESRLPLHVVVAQTAGAPARHAGGRGFESLLPLHIRASRSAATGRRATLRPWRLMPMGVRISPPAPMSKWRNGRRDRSRACWPMALRVRVSPSTPTGAG